MRPTPTWLKVFDAVILFPIGGAVALILLRALLHFLLGGI